MSSNKIILKECFTIEPLSCPHCGELAKGFLLMEKPEASDLDISPNEVEVSCIICNLIVECQHCNKKTVYSSMIQFQLSEVATMPLKHGAKTT